jgi:PAS domain S-box-containing protein
MEQPLISKRYSYLLVGILGFLGLYLASLYSYLLFHSLAEIFSIVVACGIFMVAWNARRSLDNHYFLFIGIAYLFVGGLDLIHTLAYKGMGVFQGYETNLSAQLWIAARYMGSLSLFLAPFFSGRKVKINFILFAYALATFLLLLSIFYWNIFPVCFIEGVGLTSFKKISEYIISLILLASIALLLKNRREFDRKVLQWVVWSIIVSIASELAFTFYIGPYGFFNLIGHFLKILSFYFIYKAIIETGLTRPYDLLFRNLKQTEVLLREEKNRIQSYLDIAGVILLVIDADQKVSLVNKKGCEILGYNENEMIGKNWFDTFIPEKNRDEVKAEFRKSVDGEIHPAEYFENAILTRNGEERVIGWHNAVLRDGKGNITSTLSSGEDITERKKMEKTIRASEERMREQAAHLQAVLDTAPAIIWIAHDRECREIIGNRAAYVFLRVPEGTDMSKSGRAPERLAHYRVFMDGVELTAREMPIQRVAASGQGLSDYSMEFVFDDGTVRSLLGNISPVLDSEGQPNGAIAAFIDITERKRMAEELRKSRDELELRVQERTAELAKANERLGEQSQILESFFTSTITPLVFLDRDFNFIRVNEAYAKACQRKVSEFPGHNHFEFYPSDAKAKFEQVVQTKEPYVAIAKPFTFPDHPERGTSYWDWILTPLLDQKGEVEYLVFSLEDVTERKRAEEAVKAERQRFNNVLEMLPAYLVLLTPDYHVPFANRFFQDRFGESHGKRCFEYLFGRSEPCEICETYTALKTNAPYHWEWIGPDGRTYDVFDYPFTDTDGSTLILEMGIDITERKRAEEALRAAHQYTRSLIEASPDPLVTINPGGKVMDVNSATELATGVSRQELIGSDFSDYFTEPESAREGYRTTFSKGTVRDYPLAIRHTSGMITDVLYNATVYRNEVGEIQGIFAAARDITERKRAEEALKESETRLRALSSQLLTAQETERKRIAMELHDGIGQMLTAIKFKVENILQEKGKGEAATTRKSLESIVPMVRETVEEVRRMQMDLHPSTLDDLGILATLGWFCREYQKIYSHIRIEKEIGLQENEVSIPLRAVIYRMTQEALNNIAKHSKADLIRLSLKKKESTIEWIVKDNGMGFNLEEILSSDRTRRGLGLNSMRERAQLSGGTFEIETAPGAGTVIRANWPV